MPGRDIVIESLDFSCIKPGEYDIVALPVKIKDENRSPVRVVFIENK